MMQGLWQKKLELKYDKDVIDIVQFGSSLMYNQKANDLDIAVIYNKIPIKEQLKQSQEIKKQLQKISEIPVHINSFDLYSLLERSNFSKEGILLYGRSLITKRYFAESMGFQPKIQIRYSLKNLKKKEKVRFHYSLQGKKGKYGLLRKYGGKLINPGLIEIPPEYEYLFSEAI
ncbi:MAG: hypothetical protein AABX73_03880, partial [Nanoarchaeota archaeon]